MLRPLDGGRSWVEFENKATRLDKEFIGDLPYFHGLSDQRRLKMIINCRKLIDLCSQWHEKYFQLTDSLGMKETERHLKVHTRGIVSLSLRAEMRLCRLGTKSSFESVGARKLFWSFRELTYENRNEKIADVERVLKMCLDHLYTLDSVASLRGPDSSRRWPIQTIKILKVFSDRVFMDSYSLFNEIEGLISELGTYDVIRLVRHLAKSLTKRMVDMNTLGVIDPQDIDDRRCPALHELLHKFEDDGVPLAQIKREFGDAARFFVYGTL